MSKNIFDIESNRISILVHTEAIMNDPGALEYFCLASKLSPISVYFMPITHSEDMVSLNTGKYEHQQEADASFVSLVFPQCAVHVCSFRNTEYKENSESYAKRTEAYILKIIAEEIYGAHNNYVMWRLFHFPSKPYVL